MTRTITIEHNGTSYGGQIGTIRSTRFGYEDHGILTADLTVEWPGGGIGVGGYALDTPKKNADGEHVGREGTAFGLDHIVQIMRAVGVQKWEDLKGKQIMVLFEGASLWGATAKGIASVTDENAVLIFKEHADVWKEGEDR
jgi:hypothetical protein